MSEASQDTGISAGLSPAWPERESLPASPGSAPSRTRPARTWALLALTHLFAVGLGALGAWVVLGPRTEPRQPAADEPQPAVKEPQPAAKEPSKVLPGNPQVTLETFKKIRPKMERAEVQELFGDEGRRLGWTAIGGVPETEEFEWIGRKDLASDPTSPPPKITVFFEKGKVIDRRAANLK